MKNKPMNCPTMRRKLVVTRWLSFGTGEITRPETAKWITEPCGTPLFSYDGDFCRSCLNGWWHPRNYPVTMQADLEQPCPALTWRAPVELETEYDNLYIAHFGADSREAA